jgi:hypothetical protein
MRGRPRSVDEGVGQFLGIRLKERGEMKGVLVLLAVFDQGRVKGTVENVAASGAKRKSQVSGRRRTGGLAGFPIGCCSARERRRG